MKMRDYYGPEKVVPIYIEVDDGIRLLRAVQRELNEENPKYREVCRRFLGDDDDFSEANLKAAGIERRYENIDGEKCLKEIYTEVFNVEY